MTSKFKHIVGKLSVIGTGVTKL